jgi:hypothetical protein
MGDKHLFDLKKRNWAIREVLGPHLKGEVVYNESGMAQTWQPRPHRTPNVIIDPRFAFGRAAVLIRWWPLIEKRLPEAPPATFWEIPCTWKLGELVEVTGPAS